MRSNVLISRLIMCVRTLGMPYLGIWQSQIRGKSRGEDKDCNCTKNIAISDLYGKLTEISIDRNSPVS